MSKLSKKSVILGAIGGAIAGTIVAGIVASTAPKYPPGVCCTRDISSLSGI